MSEWAVRREVTRTATTTFSMAFATSQLAVWDFTNAICEVANAACDIANTVANTLCDIANAFRNVEKGEWHQRVSGHSTKIELKFKKKNQKRNGGSNLLI